MATLETLPPTSSSHTTNTSSSLVANHTDPEPFDLFCTDMMEGPLLWAVVSVPCSLVGVIASAWVLCLLLWKRRNHGNPNLSSSSSSSSSNDMYMLDLTLMDLIFNVCVLPSALCYFLWKTSAQVQVFNFGYCLSMSGRPLFMVCICVDCFMAVLRPITYRNLAQSSYRLVLCMLVWGFTLVYGLMFVLFTELFSTPYNIIPNMLSLPPITVCDLLILRALRKPDPSGKTEVHPQKQRAMQTITQSLVMAVVSYLPPVLLFGLVQLLPLTRQQIHCQVSVPTLMTNVLGSTIQPLLYLSNMGHLQKLRARCGGAVAS